MVPHQLKPWQWQSGQGTASVGSHTAAGHSSSISLSLEALRSFRLGGMNREQVKDALQKDRCENGN